MSLIPSDHVGSSPTPRDHSLESSPFAKDVYSHPTLNWLHHQIYEAANSPENFRQAIQQIFDEINAKHPALVQDLLQHPGHTRLWDKIGFGLRQLDVEVCKKYQEIYDHIQRKANDVQGEFNNFRARFDTHIKEMKQHPETETIKDTARWLVDNMKWLRGHFPKDLNIRLSETQNEDISRRMNALSRIVRMMPHNESAASLAELIKTLQKNRFDSIPEEALRRNTLEYAGQLEIQPEVENVWANYDTRVEIIAKPPEEQLQFFRSAFPQVQHLVEVIDHVGNEGITNLVAYVYAKRIPIVALKMMLEPDLFETMAEKLTYVDLREIDVSAGAADAEEANRNVHALINKFPNAKILCLETPALLNLPDLEKVQYIQCAHCKNLTNISSNMPHLKGLDCNNCNNLQSITANIKALTTLDCHKCHNLRTVTIDLNHLIGLAYVNCPAFDANHHPDTTIFEEVFRKVVTLRKDNWYHWEANQHLVRIMQVDEELAIKLALNWVTNYEIAIAYIRGDVLEKICSSLTYVDLYEYSFKHEDNTPWSAQEMYNFILKFPLAETLIIDGMPNIRSIPPSRILKNLSCRQMPDLRELPLGMVNLETLDCEESQLPSLPHDMDALRDLNCHKNRQLTDFPRDMPSLEMLNISGCIGLQTMNSNLPSLKRLYADKCLRLERLPENMYALENLTCRNCPKLTLQAEYAHLVENPEQYMSRPPPQPPPQMTGLEEVD